MSTLKGGGTFGVEGFLFVLVSVPKSIDMEAERAPKREGFALTMIGSGVLETEPGAEVDGRTGGASGGEVSSAEEDVPELGCCVRKRL